MRKHTESNGSITLAGLTDGCGNERGLNIHGYRVANGGNTLNLAVLDSRGVMVGAISLEPTEIRELLIQIGELI